MYDVTYQPRVNHGRAYQIFARERYFVFVGNVNVLTQARKRAIAQVICDAYSVPVNAENIRWVENRLSRMDDLVTRDFVQVNLENPDEVSHGIDYSHTQGCGNWPAFSTSFHKID